VRLRVGLTGGIGSGKTEVGAVFASLGALVIDADELAREAVAPGSEGLRRIAERWPRAIAADGSLDRGTLAAIVFADADARRELNAIVHPVVRALAARRDASAGADQIVVQDVPLLFESGLDETCDATVLVIADERARIARTMARSDLSQAEVQRRMRAQIDPAQAQSRATFTIRNDGSFDDLRAEARRVWEALNAMRARP
jgi:dephospho-CoA kinase